jgi:hypothetical protein
MCRRLVPTFMAMQARAGGGSFKRQWTGLPGGNFSAVGFWAFGHSFWEVHGRRAKRTDSIINTEALLQDLYLFRTEAHKGVTTAYCDVNAKRLLDVRFGWREANALRFTKVRLLQSRWDIPGRYRGSTTARLLYSTLDQGGDPRLEMVACLSRRKEGVN